MKEGLVPVPIEPRSRKLNGGDIEQGFCPASWKRIEISFQAAGKKGPPNLANLNPVVVEIGSGEFDRSAFVRNRYFLDASNDSAEFYKVT